MVAVDSIFSASHIRKVQREAAGGKLPSSGGSVETASLPATPTSSPAHQPCPTTVLICVIHAGSVLEPSAADPNKASDLTTFRTAFEGVMRHHYPAMLGHVAFRLIPAPALCSEALAVLSSLSPYSFQTSPSAMDGLSRSFDSIPVGALPLFGVSSPEYHECVARMVCCLNQTYQDFLHTEEGCGFSGQVVLVADSVGSLLAYDVLSRNSHSRFGSDNSLNEGDPPHSPGLFPPRPNPLISISDGTEESQGDRPARTYRKSHSHPQESDPPAAATHDAASLNRLLSAPPLRRRSSGSSDHGSNRLDFEVSELFLLGSPLGLILAYRKMLSCEEKNGNGAGLVSCRNGTELKGAAAPPLRPHCGQVYNLFHPTDPCTARLEPLLSARFSQMAPVNVPRYQKYPLGDGQPTHLLEYIQTMAHMFTITGDVPGAPIAPGGRRTSEASITSTLSGLADPLPLTAITSITQRWWGTKRIDYALYCPEGLANFPAHALPHLFHASFWESTDVIAFILRQLTRSENVILQGEAEKEVKSSFTPSQPREKWNKKRTSVKLKNMTANHRANDVIVKEGCPQILSARFVYGPLDMVTLTGEKIDIHIVRDLRSGEWKLLNTEVTDKNGRVVYCIPQEKTLGFGMYPVKMVVRGDHTSVDFFLAVVPPKTECAVFSIDGSFTASMSVTGRDPKVRAGAVDVVRGEDVCRHWQELGYLIIYVTGRPDMQQQKVVSWLAQHNFPHGLVSFADGLSTDPLRHKADYLRHLQKEADIILHVAYGSSKDIWVYSSIGLKPSEIFIVGKVSKKHHAMATLYQAVINDTERWLRRTPLRPQSSGSISPSTRQRTYGPPARMFRPAWPGFLKPAPETLRQTDHLLPTLWRHDLRLCMCGAALRKTMLRAHRQAWAWQDEWVGLTMADIRRLEKETQEALARKMGSGEEEEQTQDTAEVNWNAIDKDNVSAQDTPVRTALISPGSSSNTSFDLHVHNWRMESIVRDSESSSNEEFFDAEDSPKSSTVKLLQFNIPMGKVLPIVPKGRASTDRDVVMVAVDSIFSASHIRKVQREAAGGKLPSSGGSVETASLPATPTSSPAHQPCPTTVLICVIHAGSVLEPSAADPNKASDLTTFRTAFEGVMRHHYPAMLGHVAFRLIPAPALCSEALAVLSSLSPYSFQTSPSAMDGLSRSFDSIPVGALPLFGVSSPEYHECVARMVCCLNQTYQDFLHTEEGCGFSGQVVLVADSVGSLLAYDVLSRNSHSRFGSDNSLNEGDPPHSPGLFPPRPNPLISISDGTEESQGDRPARTYRKSHSHPQESDPPAAATHDAASLNRLLSAPPLRRRSSGSSDHGSNRLDFEVSELFLLGSPLGLILAYRKMLSCEEKNGNGAGLVSCRNGTELKGAAAPPLRPHCGQVYNLFHPTDPCTARLEPLLSARFSQMAPVNVPRYQKYPLGDGQPTHLLEYIQTMAHMFTITGDVPGAPIAPGGRRTSEASITSTLSGLADPLPLTAITSITQRWWGTKRIDYALYCPEGLANFPAHALPHLFHASFWESTDVIAFILRQLTRSENVILQGEAEKEVKSSFTPSQPREKWNKKRTSVKLKNMTANHRANDVIVKEGCPQILSARFVYGPLDMVTLTGEKIDIHIVRDLRSGEWKLLNTEVTDKNGRVVYCIPQEKTLGFGMYPVKMVVRGDHTSVDFFLAVVPPKTECAVFSIDGSFTASMSVTGRDPKVRAGAVDVVRGEDVCRHWQELGYLIIYVTGRPDMQQQKVVSWLAQHNFPHGLVSFADGLSTDPLRHKADYLRHLQKELTRQLIDVVAEWAELTNHSVPQADIILHVAYGSSKDIWVYSSIGLKPSEIFIVGKVSKKHHAMAT
ncbi:PITPNM2, partial [Cordylochernes scorpioides]